MSEMPPDPFDGVFPPGFDSLPHEYQALVRELDRAGEPLRALHALGSFTVLARAVRALDDDKLVMVLLAAIIDVKRQIDSNWRDWLTRESG